MYTSTPSTVKPLALAAYPLDDPARSLKLPYDTQVLDLVEANTHAVVAFGPSRWCCPAGRREGPLKPLRRKVIALDLAGTKLLTLEGKYEREWIYVRDVRTGKGHRVARPGRGLTYLRAARNFVALVKDRTIDVVDIRTGRVAYRVRRATCPPIGSGRTGGSSSSTTSTSESRPRPRRSRSCARSPTRSPRPTASRSSATRSCSPRFWG